MAEEVWSVANGHGHESKIQLFRQSKHALCTEVQELDISHDNESCALGIRQSQRFNHHVIFYSHKTQRHKENLILVMFNDLVELSSKFRKAKFIQRTFEYREL